MGFRGWFCLVLGVIFFFLGAVLGILAIQHATEISAYHHARRCPPGAPSTANCLRTVDGTVVGVTEGSGDSAVYALDVLTASTTLHLRFSSDSPMLGYAVDGNPAVVTTWRGVPVSVLTDGRFDTTQSVPETALAGDLGFSETAGGMGVVFVVGALLIRQSRRFGYTYLRTRPMASAVLSMLFLGGLVVAIGGGVLDGQPSRLGPDLTATSAALAAVVGLSVWLGIITKRRAGQSAATWPRAQGLPDGAPGLSSAIRRSAPGLRTAGTRPRARMRPAGWARVLSALAAVYVPMLLTVAVLFGIFVTSHDGPGARAFRYAPACRGETNLATCVGDFTAVINGVRAPANAANFADIAYVTPDDAINTWASFGGDTAAIVRQASADERASTPLTIKVWRRAIVGAEFGGRWHWAWDDPPGNTIPAAFLAVSFGLLLIVVRLRVHRRAGSRATRQRLLLEDLGQVAAAAASIALLAYGLWSGAILAGAVLLWLGLSARRSLYRSRGMLRGLAGVRG